MAVVKLSRSGKQVQLVGVDRDWETHYHTPPKKKH